MKVYFARHGQTKYNLLEVHQPDGAQLSGLGIKQAETLARRFSKIPIDIIYSSPLERAKQTIESDEENFIEFKERVKNFLIFYLKKALAQTATQAV